MSNLEKMPVAAVKDGVRSDFLTYASSCDPLKFSERRARAIEEARPVVKDEVFTCLQVSTFREGLRDDPFESALQLLNSCTYRLGPSRLCPEAVEHFRLALRKGNELECVFIGGAPKVQNPLKTMGNLDLADWFALSRFKSFVDDLEKILNRPVSFHFIWEGRVHIPWTHVTLQHIDACHRELMNVKKKLDPEGKVQVHTYDDLARQQGHDLQVWTERAYEVPPCSSWKHSEWFQSFGQTCLPPSHEEMSLSELTAWYVELARLGTEDCQLVNHVLRDFVAYQRVMSQLREHHVVDKAFPNHALRFTARPRAGAFAFSSLGRRKAMLPHHCVPVLKESSGQCSFEHAYLPLERGCRAVVDSVTRQFLTFIR